MGSGSAGIVMKKLKTCYEHILFRKNTVCNDSSVEYTDSSSFYT